MTIWVRSINSISFNFCSQLDSILFSIFSWCMAGLITQSKLAYAHLSGPQFTNRWDWSVKPTVGLPQNTISPTTTLHLPFAAPSLCPNDPAITDFVEFIMRLCRFICSLSHMQSAHPEKMVPFSIWQSFFLNYFDVIGVRAITWTCSMPFRL